MPVKRYIPDKEGSHSSRLPYFSLLPHYLVQPLSNMSAESMKRQLLKHAPNELVVGAQQTV